MAAAVATGFSIGNRWEPSSIMMRPRETLQYEAVDQLLWRNNGQVQVQAFVLIRGSASRDAAR